MGDAAFSQLVLQTTSGYLILHFTAHKALASTEGLGRSQVLGAAQGAPGHATHPSTSPESPLLRAGQRDEDLPVSCTFPVSPLTNTCDLRSIPGTGAYDSSSV